MEPPLNRSIPADGNKRTSSRDARSRRPRRALGGAEHGQDVKDTAKTRKVAILAADGVDTAAIEAMKKALTEAGAVAKVVAPRGGTLQRNGGIKVPVDFSLLTVGSVLFDAVFVPGGRRA